MLALSNLHRNIHLFLDNIELRIENKNFSLEKNCLIMQSLIGRNMAIYVHNNNNITYEDVLNRNILEQKNAMKYSHEGEN